MKTFYEDVLWMGEQGLQFLKSKSKLKLQQKIPKHEIFVHLLLDQMSFDSLKSHFEDLHNALFFRDSTYYSILNRVMRFSHVNVFPSEDAVYTYKSVFYLIVITKVVQLV